jgi:hypothetical protein
MEFEKPPGFSSADNGAVHLHLLRVLGLTGAKECADQYHNLTALVDNLQPYFNFVACTRFAMGPARRWIHDGHTLTILNRYHGFAVDGFVGPNARGNGGVGFHGGYSPFQHGLKNMTAASAQYGFQFKVNELATSDSV